MAEKLISIEEAAQRVVDALGWIVGYELNHNRLHFTFDKPRRVRNSSILTLKATYWIEVGRVSDGSEPTIIHELEKMFGLGSFLGLFQENCVYLAQK